MRALKIYCNEDFAGVLTEVPSKGFLFRYDDVYYSDITQPAVSLTLPKTTQEYQSKFLFPFFYNMLSEGVNRDLQSTQLKIDKNDHFGLLMATARWDTIGSITVKLFVKA